MRFSFIPPAIFLLSACMPAAHAGDEDFSLKMEPTLIISRSSNDDVHTFISAQRMESKKDDQIEASGSVELRHGKQAVYADHMLFLRDNKELVAEGDVRITQEGMEILGPQLNLNLDSHVGNMQQPLFQFNDTHARGSANTLHMNGLQNYTLHNATYTTCPAGDDDWLLKMGVLEIDRNRQVGIAHNARVEFMGVPILYTPWMDFSLNNQRKSGFLGPTFGGTGKGGLDVTLPFFWNIASNLDATIAPRMMSKRGLMFNNEFRYLQPNYFGEAHLDILPDDRIANTTRSRQVLKQSNNWAAGLGSTINFNRVSDDAYFRDLSDAVNATSQTHLVREGELTYGNSWWYTSARVRSFQTLQDPKLPVTPPYRTMPQINLDAQYPVAGGNAAFKGEYADFRHPNAISGQRLVAYPSVSYPMLPTPALYLTPKFGVHYTYYSLGKNNDGLLPDAGRTVPIFSLDSGLELERNVRMADQDYIQTLEPRAYYVYIPYREQNTLPNFDSAQADFNFAQMFTENRFFGRDRIGDSNQVTLALTSRLLAQDSGAERLRLAVGERFSLQTPQVNLVMPTASTNKSDILFAASGQVTRTWFLDSLFQFNPNQSHSEKFNFATRYQPESGKVLNLGYRFTRNNIRQVDVSTQWPLSDRWHGVARWNYSLEDRRLVEALAGLEYNQSCWTVRMVAQHFATSTQETTTGIFLQLELNELVRVGPDPLGTLKQSVPGYTKLN